MIRLSNSSENAGWFLATVEHFARSGTEEDRRSLEQTVANVRLSSPWNERVQPLITKINSSDSSGYHYIEIAHLANSLMSEFFS
jgi:hypothetical protein